MELRAAATAVAEPVVRARPPGFAKYNATTESALGESSGEAESSGSGGGGAISAATVAVAPFVEGDRPPRIAKNSTTSKWDAGSSWSRDGGATSAAVAAADVRSVAERSSASGEVSLSIRSHGACVINHKKTKNSSSMQA